jgi:hypothetical protein
LAIYYFHQWCGDEHIPDHEGSFHPDHESARDAAIQGARCIMARDIGEGLLRLDQRVDIHDADGIHLATVSFADAITVQRQA